jgi:transposase
MNPYPQDCSVLILDNCAIHKSEVLREVIEATGKKNTILLIASSSLSQVFTGIVLDFLPPYSPDFNPIEESFSCGQCL